MQFGKVEDSAIRKDAMLSGGDAAAGILRYGCAVLCPSVAY